MLALEPKHVVDVRIHPEVGIGDRLLQQLGQPKALRPSGRFWQEAIANPDFRMYPHVYNVLGLKGQHFPAILTFS